MGAYKSIDQEALPHKLAWRGIGDLYVKPHDFTSLFTQYQPIESGDGKVTRVYYFAESWSDTPMCYLQVYDFKSTDVYDTGLPTPDAFWNASTYESLHVALAWVNKPDWAGAEEKLIGIDFQQWVYSYLNQHLSEQAGKVQQP